MLERLKRWLIYAIGRLIFAFMALNCAIKDGFRLFFPVMEPVYIMATFSVSSSPVWTLTYFSHMMRFTCVVLWFI